MRVWRPGALGPGLACLAAALAAGAAGAAEPREDHGQLFAPLQEWIAPCVERADRCRAAGGSAEACRSEAERCFADVEARVKESTLRDLDRDDPRARAAFVAIDVQDQCIAAINGCAERGGGLAACVAERPACEPEAGPGCCPAACAELWHRRTAAGEDAVEAFGQVYLRDPSCFPHLPRAPVPAAPAR
jgi:hypothetical protein